MKIKLLNQKGKELEEKISLDKTVWETPENADLVAQALYVYNSNRRRGTANVKTRAEVSGGGRKPWRQKGTGRARAGSTRSPLWVKGGVTFVPNNRNWAKSINDKMKKKAIASVLSSKLKDDSIKFISFGKKDDFKNLREDIVKLVSGGKTLVISENENILKSVRNIECILIGKPLNMNIYDVLNNTDILVDSESIEIIENRFKNGK